MGTVPAARKDEDSAVWQHDLVRHKFSFAAITGNLTKFRVNCVVHVIEDDVKLGTQWTTPQPAGPCVLHVYGQPGTTFKLVEDW
jgi:hypothetical protein